MSSQRRGNSRPAASSPPEGSGGHALTEATDAAIAAASHLTPMDDGAVAALRYLAHKIDTELELRELALRFADEHEQKPPSVDNVSVPTYLKYCESLGLTPAGRARAQLEAAKGGAGGKLGQLRALSGGKKSG